MDSRLVFLRPLGLRLQKCTVCHATEAGGKIEGLDQKKAHALCQDCHKKDAAKKAPVKCDGCQVGS